MANRGIVDRLVGALTPERSGCRDTALVGVALVSFASATVATGLFLVVDGSVGGLVLYGAGAPISGLFAAVAGGLPLAWPLDITLWVIAAVAITRKADRRGRLRPTIAVVALALLWGLVVFFAAS